MLPAALRAELSASARKTRPKDPRISANIEITLGRMGAARMDCRIRRYVVCLFVCLSFYLSVCQVFILSEKCELQSLVWPIGCRVSELKCQRNENAFVLSAWR